MKKKSVWWKPLIFAIVLLILLIFIFYKMIFNYIGDNKEKKVSDSDVIPHFSLLSSKKYDKELRDVENAYKIDNKLPDENIKFSAPNGFLYDKSYIYKKDDKIICSIKFSTVSVFFSHSYSANALAYNLARQRKQTSTLGITTINSIDWYAFYEKDTNEEGYHHFAKIDDDYYYLYFNTLKKKTNKVSKDDYEKCVSSYRTFISTIRK